MDSWLAGFSCLGTGAFLVPDHLYIYGFTLAWIVPSGMDMSRKKQRSFAAAAVLAMFARCHGQVHCCSGFATRGAGWWLCDGSQLCFVGAPYLEEPPNHHEVSDPTTNGLAVT